MALRLLTIKGTDLSEYVEKSDYNVSRERKFTSWTDCNYHEHRNYIVNRVYGTVSLSFVNDMKTVSFDDFVAMFDAPTVPVGVYVMNTGEFSEFEAYWKIDTEYMNDGTRLVTRVTLSIDEV